MPFVDENLEAGLHKDGDVQVGNSNFDSDQNVEEGLRIPWPSDPSASYLYYDCAIGTMLDSGIVVHNRLPQVDRAPDSLSFARLNDPKLDKIVVGGVNLTCRDQYQDIVQRMGHARYWFRLWGQALRVGYQVPIPGIVTIGGVPAIPYDLNPQWAYNRIFPGANYSGVILWHAVWSLWYTTSVPPVNNSIPAADPSAHTSIGDGSRISVPGNIQVPYSQADDNAVQQPIPFVGRVK